VADMNEPGEANRRGTARRIPHEVVEYLRSFFSDCTSVLDLGCGQGDFLFDGTVGLDMDFLALKEAGRRVVQADLAESIPLRSATFDGVLAKDILEHLPEPARFMNEIARVSSPGARLVITTPRAIPRAVWDDYTHMRGFTRPALERLLAATGWTEIRIRRYGAVPIAGRLGLVRFIPALLRFPGIGHYFGTNWLVTATRARPSVPVAG
jgi:SAM-dependent methyltransferase